MFNWYFVLQSVILMFLYVEQDMNLAQQSCSGLKNEKIAQKKRKKSGKKLFCSQEGMGWNVTLQPGRDYLHAGVWGPRAILGRQRVQDHQEDHKVTASLNKKNVAQRSLVVWHVKEVLHF